MHGVDRGDAVGDDDDERLILIQSIFRFQKKSITTIANIISCHLKALSDTKNQEKKNFNLFSLFSLSFTTQFTFKTVASV